MNSYSVPWIVVITLFGAFSLISSSPESRENILETSIAIQKFRDAPMANTSNDIASPVFSDIELLQRINEFGLRTTRDVYDDAIAGLDYLNIIASISSGPAGVCISIITKLLQMFFPSGDPVKLIQDIVWKEREKEQRQKLLSIQRTMKEIKKHYEITNDIRIPHRSMLSLYTSLNLECCQFMYDDNIEKSADYFSEFATIHIAVIQALIIIHPKERIYQQSLFDNVKQYVAYAKHAQQIETKNNMQNNRITRVRSMLDTYIQKWTKQLPGHMQTEINKQGLIRNNEVISFHLSNLPGQWISCAGSGSQCKRSSCPGKDNPMERGPKYGNSWKCRGEIFWIQSIDDTDGFIKSCSRVGILYSKNDKGHWWLSGNCKAWVGCQTKTSVCVGDKAANMRDGRCSWEVWKITARDKLCGQTIQDRDVVELRSHQNEPPIPRYYAIHIYNVYTKLYGKTIPGYYTIFRSNVGHGDYKKDIECHG